MFLIFFSICSVVTFRVFETNLVCPHRVVMSFFCPFLVTGFGFGIAVFHISLYLPGSTFLFKMSCFLCREWVCVDGVWLQRV